MDTVRSLIVIAAIVCICGGSKLSEEKPPLYLLALAPYPETREGFIQLWDGGPGLIPAARLAVEQINNRTDILAEYTLTLVERDSGCGLANEGILKYTSEVFHGEKNIVGVIGPACSHVTLKTGFLGGPDRAALVQVSIASSQLLVNRTLYPYSFGTLGSTLAYVDTILELVRMNNWERIGIMFDALSIYYESIHSTLLKELERRNLSDIVGFSSAIYDSYLPLEELQQSYTRVSIILAAPALEEKLVCLAYYNRITFPVYQWIFLDRFPMSFGNVTFFYGREKYECSKFDLTTTLEGAVFLSFKLSTPTPNATTISGMTYHGFREEYLLKLEEHRHELGSYIPDQPYSTVYYDAVWAMALGLNGSLQALEEMNMSLLDYRTGDREIPDVIKESMYRVDFPGVSGSIKFDPDTGQIAPFIDLSQISNASEVAIGFYNTTHISGSGFYLEGSFEIKVVHVDIWAFSIVMLITLTLLGLAVCLHIVNIVYSKHKSIKASSAKLNRLIFLGCYLMVVSTVTYSSVGFSPPTDPVTGAILCNLIFWSTNLGLTLILGTVCVKTWRIFRIFVYFRDPGRFLSDNILFLTVLTLLLPVIIVLLVCTIVDPAVPEEVDTITTDDDIPVIEREITCTYPTYAFILTLYQGIILFWTLYMSIVSRHVRTKNFKITRSNSALLFCWLMISAIGYSLYLVSMTQSWDRNISYVILNLTINALLFVCITFIILPPTIPLAKEKLRKYRCHNSSYSNV